jgi:PilZ domain
MTVATKKHSGQDRSSPRKPGIESRRYPRLAIDVRIKVKMFQSGEFRSCWGRSTGLGRDGIGATLTADLEVGEIVTLELPLPLSTRPLKIRAIVRYGHGLHYGFEFLTLTEMQRETLGRVCEILNVKA